MTAPPAPPAAPAISPTARIAFIGGGNMAQAIIGGLRRSGVAGDAIRVVEPGEAQREALRSSWGVRTAEHPGPGIADASCVVWAIKPQIFASACVPCRPFVGTALQLSVMAGIRSETIARATGSDRVVRAMPNMPALIGQGVAGLFASGVVSAAERATVEALLASTGTLVWVEAESDLDAVTALSGSGPAYVFYLIEAMIEAAGQMGLSAAQGRVLALKTLSGATALAQLSAESPATLRAQVTSKGGTTHAALAFLEHHEVKAAFVSAMLAARKRARELGGEFAGG